MSIQAVLLPVVVQVLLVFVLLGFTASSRMQAFRAGLRPQDIALSKEGYPPRAQQFANCYGNQFEMPVLFLLAVVFGIVLHQTGWFFVLLEWLFVACRISHAFVHTTSNNVSLRGPLFLGSAIVTVLMWLLVFDGVFLGGLY